MTFEMQNFDKQQINRFGKEMKDRTFMLVASKIRWIPLLVILATLLSASDGFGGVISGSLTPIKTLGFKHIVESNDGPTQIADGAIGEAQLFLDVFGWNGSAATINPSEESVLFVFRNAGPEASIIAQVYFDDGALLGLSAVIDSDDSTPAGFVGIVDFTADGSATPPELPSGNNVGFETTAGFLADYDTGRPAVGNGVENGVNPGEELGIIFSLKGPPDPLQLTVADVITSLDFPTIDFSLHVGVHVQGFASGGSEAFVSDNPPTPGPEPNDLVVPEPTSIAIFGLAALGMAGAGRRRKQRK